MPINKKFLVFNFGVFLLFSGIAGTIVLVSSLNVEDGLGTTSLAVAFGSSIASAFVIPVLIDRIGCRLVIVIAELGYLMFVLCNVYTSYNLIVGGIFYGIGEAAVWTAYPTVASRYASKHAITGSKTEGKYKNHYIGYLFTSVQTSVIFGNAAGFLILYIDRSLSKSFNDTISRQVDFSVCGINDCQDENVTAANLDQYTPAFPTTRYVVIAVFSLLIVVAIVLHLIFLPRDKPTLHSMKSNSDVDIDRHEDMSELKNGLVQSDSAKVDIAPGGKQQKMRGFQHLKSTLKQSMDLFFTLKHLLVVLLPIYNGLSIGFVIGELTRSYASCILGLDKVAVGAILYGTTDALFSYIAGKVAGKFGRNPPFLFAFVLDLANYLFCLFWVVDEHNSWMVYFLFLSFGITDGIWQTLINVMYEEYFTVQREIAFNLWNVLVNIGTFSQFAISLYICVYHKVYIQITVMSAAVITYGISQILYHR